MKNNFRYKIIVGVLLVALTLTSGIAFITTAIASTPIPISEFFPDPVLAELVAINLGLTVDDEVFEWQLHDVLVLNLDPDERVTDFTGVELLVNLEHFYADYHGLDDLTAFASLVNLRVIDLVGNYVEDLRLLSRLLYLEELRVTGNPIVYFADFEDIMDFEVPPVVIEGDVSRDDLLVLLTTVGLSELSLFDVPLDEQLIGLIGGMIGLESLTLSGVGLESLDFVEGLVNLRELVLIGNNLVDVSLLASLRDLEIVDLTANNISDLRPLSGLGVNVIAEFQRVALPVVMVGEGQMFDVYDVNGNLPTVDFEVGDGTLEDGMIVWTEEGNNELFWYSSGSNFIFSGLFQQGAWGFEPEWYDYYMCEVDCDDDEDEYWMIVVDSDENDDSDDELDDDFDYDYYYGNVNGVYVLDEDGNYVLAVVVIESICYEDCDAYLVVDESGHVPENDVDDDDVVADTGHIDDADNPDDEVIYYDYVVELNFDDYIPYDFDFYTSDIASDPDFDFDSLNNGNNNGSGGDSDDNPVININVGNQYSAGQSGGGIFAGLPQTGVTVVAVLGVGVVLVGTGVVLGIMKRKSESSCSDNH